MVVVFYSGWACLREIIPAPLGTNLTREAVGRQFSVVSGEQSFRANDQVLTLHALTSVRITAPTRLDAGETIEKFVAN